MNNCVILILSRAQTTWRSAEDRQRITHMKAMSPTRAPKKAFRESPCQGSPNGVEYSHIVSESEIYELNSGGVDYRLTRDNTSWSYH